MSSTSMVPAKPMDATRIRVRLPASFDFDWTQRFLQMRCVSSLEAWAGDTYTRTLWLDEKPITLTIRYVAGTDAGARFDVSCTPAIDRERLRSMVVRLFDLDADLDAFASLVRRDAVLGPLVRRRPHVRLPRLLDPFEGLVRAMLGQQVTVRAASTMTDRFARRFGTPVAAAMAPAGDIAARRVVPDADGRRGGIIADSSAIARHEVDAGLDADPLFAFPRPGVIAEAGADVLRTIGLTRAKAKAIAGLAETLSSGRLDCATLTCLPPDEAQAALLAVPGIGPWTASYVRMRVLGDRDAFPAADLGVIKALDALGVPRARHTAIAEAWRPWRAYATLHLWESLSA